MGARFPITRPPGPRLSTSPRQIGQRSRGAFLRDFNSLSKLGGTLVQTRTQSQEMPRWATACMMAAPFSCR